MSARRPAIHVTLAAASPVGAAALRRIAVLVLADQRRSHGLNVIVVDDRSIRVLNRRHLRHDRATDVIAFPLGDCAARPHGPDAHARATRDLLGEVYVSATTARRESRRRGIPAGEELTRYVVHGILHLCGFDDHEPEDRRRMWERQECLVETCRSGRAGI